MFWSMTTATRPPVEVEVAFDEDEFDEEIEVVATVEVVGEIESDDGEEGAADEGAADDAGSEPPGGPRAEPGRRQRGYRRRDPADHRLLQPGPPEERLRPPATLAIPAIAACR